MPRCHGATVQLTSVPSPVILLTEILIRLLRVASAGTNRASTEQGVRETSANCALIRLEHVQQHLLCVIIFASSAVS